MNRYGIVVVGYNRIDSLQRLFDSLERAHYDEDVDLIISLDNSGNNQVFNYANSFEWIHGNKKLILAEEKLGLRNHVLQCGNYINRFNFDAVIVLEDDLYVSSDFFNYAKQAIDFYGEDERIAGISLYQHLWNVNADRPFLAVISKYDTFFMQYAQSWGQIWTKNQWNLFYQWYINQEYKNVDLNKIPDNLLKWPESSWLKFHIQYCIAKNKFFVYPYTALSTNFADAGTHYASNTNKMQVPILTSTQKKYTFVNFEDSNVIYDAYFENLLLAREIGLNKNEVTVDIYGMKKENARYLITMDKLPFKVLKSFGLKMRPQDMNVIYNIEGDDIFLYDTLIQENKVNNKKNDIKLTRWMYDTRAVVLVKQNLMKILIFEIKQKLRSLKSKFIRK
ncbi:hypothetical protein [Priestia megaterium]|uniref:hypothetical protein n=1 Tax=Priestia megaterium TaxID=1404 RepID=UPI00244D2C44|nr:hypothetical protein [Priestia megaterium]MDH2362481.1 hypothetical protein [Priestia megaterium]